MDREFFEIFTTVNGLGVRTALKSMVCPVSDIARAIEKEDATWLDNLPEIGASTAKKIIAELKGKVAKFALGKSSSTFPEDTEPLQSPSAAPDMKEESMAVLLQLQYSRIEAESMIQKALQRNKKISNSEDLVAEIFRQQSSR
jgi:Holliday junction DNA helicase RuvA